MKTTVKLIFLLILWGCISNAQIDNKTKAKLATAQSAEESYTNKTLRYFITQTSIPSIFRGGVIDKTAFISLYYNNEKEIRSKKNNGQKITVFTIFLDTSQNQRESLFGKFSDRQRFFRYSPEEIHDFENLKILGITSAIEN